MTLRFFFFFLSFLYLTQMWSNILGVIHFYLLERAHLLVTEHTFIWLGSIIWFLIIRTFAAVKIQFSAMTAPPPPCKWFIKTCQGKARCGARWPPNTLLWRSRPTIGRPHSDNHAIHTDKQESIYKKLL